MSRHKDPSDNCPPRQWAGESQGPVHSFALVVSAVRERRYREARRRLAELRTRFGYSVVLLSDAMPPGGREGGT